METPALNRLPLRWRLTLLITLISSLTLCAAFAGYIVLDILRLHDDVDRNSQALLHEYVDRATALLERDPKATDFGLKNLRLEKDVVAAAVFSPDVRILDKYIRRGEINEFIPRPRSFVTNFSADEVVGFHSIGRGTQNLGTFYLKAEAGSEARARLVAPLRGMAALLLLSVLGSVVISRFLQRGISDPIVELSELAHKVARDNDYGARAKIEGGGETATLAHAFNSMLSTIQQRDADLVSARDAAQLASVRLAESNHMLEESNRTLETKVNERTIDLQKATNAAREANQAKSAFLAKMSHELRTPMNAIIGYSEILVEDATDRGDTSAVSDLKKILSAALHLLGLINDVLDLSKIEAGKMDLYLETFDFRRLVEEIVSTAQPLIDRNENRVVIDCPSEIGDVHADATKLRQILLNLLSNASKFTDHGEIRIKVSKQSDGLQEILAISVKDSGIGMTPDQMSKLFQAFMQAEQSTSAKYGGTGLGLAISRQFALLMGGDILVESKLGSGSTFTLTMPSRVTWERSPGPTPAPDAPAAAPVAAEPPPRAINRGTTPPTAAQRRGRVLIIGDNEKIHSSVEASLSPENYIVKSVHQVAEALEAAKTFRPHVVILDILLPDVSGQPNLPLLKASPDLANTPIILLSLDPHGEMGFALSAADYVATPLEGPNLLAILQKLNAVRTSTPILVVEDDAGTREMIVRLLQREGWTSLEAENGQVALDLLRDNIPSVVLLDLLMPQLDGFSVLREMRANPLWRDIPVVVLTSLDLTAEVRRFLEQQADRVLQKGRYNRDELMKEVRDSVNEFMRRRVKSNSPFPANP